MRVFKTNNVNKDSLVHYKIYDTYAGTDYFINDFFVVYRDLCYPWDPPVYTKGTAVINTS